jgi:hypothetical protein
VFALFLLAATSAHAQQYRYPSSAEQQNACHKTMGTWRALPPYCDNMHPRSWKKLTPDQQKYCQSSFNEPCECGKGRRFSVVKVLGCIKSNFPQDQ